MIYFYLMINSTNMTTNIFRLPVAQLIWPNRRYPASYKVQKHNRKRRHKTQWSHSHNNTHNILYSRKRECHFPLFQPSIVYSLYKKKMTSFVPHRTERRHMHCGSNRVKLITCSASIFILCDTRHRGYAFLSRTIFSPFFLFNII